MARKKAATQATLGAVTYAEKVVGIDTVRPDPEAKIHPPDQIEALRSLLRRFGQATPLTVDADGIIRKGNGTWLAMKAEGMKVAKILQASFTGLEARAYALADNRVGEMSEWDAGTVDRQLHDLKDFPDLDALKFPELDALEYGRDVVRDGPKKGMPLDLENRATVTAVLAVEQAENIERAIVATGVEHRGEALNEICLHYLQARRIK